MSADVTWSIESRGEERLVHMVGKISETLDLTPLVSEMKGAAVVLNLAKIDRINSFGVRCWIQFMEALESSAQSVAVEACAPVLVQQLNMIHHFIGGAKVRSVLAPYRCSYCEKDQNQLIELDKPIHEQLAKPVSCLGCGMTMEFDDLEQSYFAFCQSA